MTSVVEALRDGDAFEHAADKSRTSPPESNGSPRIMPAALSCDLPQLLHYGRLAKPAEKQRPTVVAERHADTTQSGEEALYLHNRDKRNQLAWNADAQITRLMTIGLNQNPCPRRRMKNAGLRMRTDPFV